MVGIMNEEQDPNSLSNLHELIHELRFEAQAEAELAAKKKTISFSVPLPEETRIEAMKICEQNGVYLSHFLRRCTERLVEEYR